MTRQSLDQYDIRPQDMKAYLQNYGWHFTRKMCDFAISKMVKNGSALNRMTTEQIDNMLRNSGISLMNNQLYDYIYVAHIAYAKYYGSSIQSDQQLAKYIKDTIDYEDSYDGAIFTEWYADMCKKGIPIDWEGML